LARHVPSSSKSESVDDYIARCPESVQAKLKQIRATIRGTVPEAKEKMSYGMPFYEYRYPGYKGRLAYFAAYKGHISFYAVPHTVPDALAKKMEQYRAAKATLQFPLTGKVPIGLLRQLVKLRKQEIDTR